MSVQCEAPTEVAAAGKDVFISYSRTHEKWVEQYLIPQLKAANLTFVIDYRDFIIGDRIADNISRAISECKYTILVMTPDYVRGRWTHMESLLANEKDQTAGGRVVALHLKECSVPPHLAERVYLDLRAVRKRDAEMERLLRQLGVSEEGLRLARDSVAKKTLQTLIELMDEPGVRDVVAELQEEFEQINVRNNAVAYYKDLHDDLHAIQMDVKQVGRDSAAQTSGEIQSWSRLRGTTRELCRKIEVFISVRVELGEAPLDIRIAKPLGRQAEELRKAVDAKDVDQLRSSLEKVGSRVDCELPILNDRIVQKLRERPLQKLIESLQGIYEEISTFDFDDTALSLLAELKAGINALTEKDQRIRELVVDHDLFQELDVELKRMRQGRESLYEDVHDSWGDITALVQDFDMAKRHPEVVTAMGQLTDMLADTERIRDDSYAEEVGDHFLDFVEIAFDAFQGVDIDLRRECKLLKDLSPKMEGVIRRMQTDE